MQLRESLAEALRTLRTQWLRTFLTMFGVVWGTASVVFLLSWGLGVQRTLEAGFSRCEILPLGGPASAAIAWK